MRLAPAQCKPGVEQAAGCMTLHPGTPWCLSAVEEQDHRMAASGLHCLWRATPVISGQWCDRWAGMKCK
jgi:hypothetical protein